MLPNVDKHPAFRDLMKNKHKAYSVEESEDSNFLVSWIVQNIPDAGNVMTFMAIPVRARIEHYLMTSAYDDWWTSNTENCQQQHP